MVDTNAASGLKWVKDEIVTSLQRVRGWLDEFAEADGEKPHLDAAVDALSEVRSVLSALQLVGPARLAAEMQTQCEDLQAESLPNPGEAAEALMLALIQLPHYLDRLEDGQADVPLALLPSINDLRGSRGAASLSEAELLVPASVLAESEMPASDVQRSLGQVAGKIRPHFHLFMLQWLREDTSRLGLASLGRLFHRLQRHIGAGIFHELFLVAEAVVEALLEGSIAADARTKALVSHLDRVIKPFITDPEAWPEAEAQAQLFDLLSLIARCRSSSYRINELRSVYGLEKIAEGEETIPAAPIAGPESESLGLLVAEEQAVHADEPQSLIEPVTPVDAELRDSFAKAAAEEAQTIRHQFALWQEDEDDENSLTALQRSFHSLKGSGRLVGAHRLGEFARAVEMLLNRMLDGTLRRSTAVVAFLEDAVGALPDLVAAEAHERPLDVAGFIARAESLALAAPGQAQEPELPEPGPRPANVIPWPAAEPGHAPVSEITPVANSGEWEAEASDDEAAEIAALAEADDELLDIFRSEAREHLEVLRAFVSRSRAEGDSAIPDEPVVRALSTLTGGARTAGLASTAKVTEYLERLFQDHRERSEDLLPLLDRTIDAVEMRLTHLPGYGEEMAALRELCAALQEQILRLEFAAVGVDAASAERQEDDREDATAETPDAADMAQSPDLDGATGEESQSSFSSLAEAETSGDAAEAAPPQVRVRPDLLNGLINDAGENSVCRSRLARQGGLMSLRLGELDRTLDRLRDQRRQLETEIEAQILLCHERDADNLVPGHHGSDPIEPDRFSTLQQLARSLAETVDDLGSLRTLLRDVQEESDTLLQQQARIADDVQDGLLRTGIGPFSQALLVQIGEQVFAVPQASVEATSRIAQSQLEACYQGQAEDFSHAGRDYRVVYLGSMLQLASQPDLGERRWLPVLLARSGDQQIAFHVDQMLGTQRVVVKPLGPELRSLPWLSGGTILPDGRVALILDLLTLAEASP